MTRERLDSRPKGGMWHPSAGVWTICTGLAEPMGRHDEGPFLDGRGLRAGAVRADGAASLTLGCHARVVVPGQ